MANASERTLDRPTPTRKPQSIAARRHQAHRPQPSLLQWAGLEPRLDAAPRVDPAQILKWAMGVWNAGFDARHAVLRDIWAAAQGVTLPDSIAGDVLRFHPRLKYGDDRRPGLIWLLRDLHTDEPCGVLRYFLDSDGVLIGRKALGRTAFDAAIKLDADENVTAGLAVCAGIEQAIAAMAQGYRPMWSVAGASALAAFPVLPGVECLTVFSGPDDGPAVAEVTARWIAAGREVRIVSAAETETPPPAIWDTGSGDP